MEPVHSNSFAAARYDSALRVVHYTYTGLINIPLGLETLRAVMKFCELNRVTGIVSDLRSMKGTFTAASEFFEKEYYPHMISHGLKCTAMVVPNDIFTRFAAQDLVKRIGTFHLQIFDGYDDACAWVASQIQQ